MSGPGTPRPAPAGVRLLPWPALSPAQQARVRALSIPAQQVEYAGAVDVQLAKLEAATDGSLAGLGILAGDEVVGFLVLMRGEKLPDWAPPGSAVVSGMRIDVARQGEGLGRAALGLVAGWAPAHWPGCTGLALAVDEDNAAGIRAYAAAGFVDQGQRVMGRIGWVRYMHRPFGPTADRR